MPDQSKVTSEIKGNLPIKGLSAKGQEAYGFKGITNSSLISVAKLCDDGCKVVFDKHKCQVFKDSKIILDAIRNPIDGLWDVVLQSPTPVASVNAITRKSQATYELANWYHASLGFPALSTLERKKKNLHSFPAMENINWKKHPPSIHTAKGHLRQEHKNLQSTKQFDADLNPSQEGRTNNIFAMVDDFHTASKAYTDLTGRFPFQSSRGNNYLFILYNYDANAILAEPIKDRSAATITKAWTKLHSRLKLGGCKPELYIMDNECSADLKKALQKESCTFQLVPPHVHRRNAAERAISTFKDHFLSILSAVNPSFPITGWDYLVPQAELTLNLLRNSRVNPKLSAWEFLFGVFNYNATPLAPPGTKVLAHSKPKQRQSWGFHGEDAWYIGPSLDHYRCVKCYIPRTGGVIDVDTVEWFPHHIPFPKFTKQEQLVQAAEDIVSILQTPAAVTPAVTFGNEVKNALLKIATILKRADPSPAKPSSLPDPVITNQSANQYELLTQEEESSNPVTDKVSPVKEQQHPTTSNQSKEKTISIQIHDALQPKLKKKPRKKATANKFHQKSKSSSYQPTPPTLQYAPATRVPFQKPFQQPYVAPAQRVPLYNPFIPQPLPFQFYQNNLGTNYRNFAVQHLQAEQIFSMPVVQHIFDENGKRMNIDKLLAKDPKIWKGSVSRELGRLANGIGVVTGTNTIRFIPKHLVPSGAKVTYANMVCDYRPLKSDPYRVRLTVGGDKLEYDGDAGSPAASLMETTHT